MDTSVDLPCWNPEGTRWTHPSTSNPKVTQRVGRSLLGQGTSERGPNNTCVVTRVHYDTLNFRTLEAVVEEGEPEGVGGFLEAKTPNNCAGELLPTSPAAARCAGDTWTGKGQTLPFVSSS